MYPKASKFARIFLMGAAFMLIAAACAPAATPAAPALKSPPFPAAGPVGSSPQVFALEQGWVDGQAVSYYNFGLNTPLNPEDPGRVRVEPGWLFITGFNEDGTPKKLVGQFTLFDVAPGDANYSDFWQINFVSPPEGYELNSIRSLAALEEQGLQIDKSPMLVNCPIVPAGSTLEGSDLELQQGWVRDQQFAYYDFGPTSPNPGKVYVFITGFDAQKQPILAAGQHFVFDAGRSAAGYSDFWLVQWVLVDGKYKADSIRSAADIPAEQVTASTMVVNYPHQQSEQ